MTLLLDGDHCPALVKDVVGVVAVELKGPAESPVSGQEQG